MREPHQWKLKSGAVLEEYPVAGSDPAFIAAMRPVSIALAESFVATKAEAEVLAKMPKTDRKEYLKLKARERRARQKLEGK